MAITTKYTLGPCQNQTTIQSLDFLTLIGHQENLLGVMIVVVHNYMMKPRREFQKMFTYGLMNRAKSFLLSTVTLAALILIVIFEDSVISDASLQSSGGIPERLQSKVGESKSIPLLSVREVTEKADMSNNRRPLNSPFSLREEGRTGWLKNTPPEFEIFKSDRLTKRFHSRVLDFFNHDCEVQAFMTWISPARSFGRRELLSVESFFKVNPRGCLMILSKTLDSTNGYTILKPILDRKFRVIAVTPDLSFLFRNTPAEAWSKEMMSGKKDPGEIPLAQNLSNLIRLAVLYKYGGVYTDTDFIFLKSFKWLKNSIGAQSMDMESGNWTRLNNAVLIFDRNHPLLFRFMEEFAATFDGNRWGHNGPYLVSRVVQRFERKPSFNFTILPPMAFYPVDWNRIAGLFKMPENPASSKWVKAKMLQLSGQTYGVHLWNKESKRIKIEEGSVIGRLISDHCIFCEDIYSS
ncbi:lactosylceramide 4-alpha-galactosyltransferase-like [Mangifera indica]|uniref:lactosylceramide 4-alpha-galactosyltransferase-like n=1 Tax=Mangifera indica TaxID=29780 RepID=UPI001CF9ECE0|nr:lactosylceramide 4-alpha-galactosyltransferase-like [Mangifera indica]